MIKVGTRFLDYNWVWHTITEIDDKYIHHTYINQISGVSETDSVILKSTFNKLVDIGNIWVEEY